MRRSLSEELSGFSGSLQKEQSAEEGKPVSSFVKNESETSDAPTNIPKRKANQKRREKEGIFVWRVRLKTH